MDIETFEVAEEATSSCTQEDLDQVKKLVDELALSGQQTLLTPEYRFPYRKMTKQESRVYKLVCPTQSDLTNYDDSAIPLRVLQVAAHAQTLGVFSKLVVWHADNADVKDPVLCGWKGTSDWSGEWFILARWGEVLLPLSELVTRAKELAIAQLRLKIEKIKHGAESALSTINETVDVYLAGGDSDIAPVSTFG